MRRKISFIAFVALLFMAQAAHAQTQQFIASYSAWQEWLPVIFLGVLVGIMITAIYYIAASTMNNQRAKANALNEMGQAVGTAILVVIIVFVLDFFGTGIFPSVTAINQLNLGTICYHQLANSQLSITNPNANFGSLNNVPIMSPTNTVCAAATGTLTPTNSINYGLFASYIIVANLTDQAASDMNALYLFDGWTGFASKFVSVTHVCISAEDLGLMCILPIGVRDTDVIFSYSPLAGYETLRRITLPLEIQADLITYLFFLQLVLLIVTLNTWPYLLAAGVLLRSNMFTRRVGGVLIGIVIAMLLIFPTVYTMEYSSFNTQGLGPIGVNNLPMLPLYELQNDGNVIIYGANSVLGQTGGYVPQNVALQGENSPSCNNGKYVYQFQCGNGNSTGKNCFSFTTAPSSQECPQVQQSGGHTVFEGYVPAGEVRGTTCRTDSDIYELVDCNTNEKLGAADVCTPLSLVPSNTPPGLCTSQLGSNINFFVLPNATRVTSYYSCMPSNLAVDEGIFAAYYFIPLFGAGTFIFSGFGGLVGQLPITPSDLLGTVGCTPEKAIANVVAFTNLYGAVAVAAYIVPLLNVIIILSAAIGLSSLLGGDTNLLGIGRLL